MKDQTWFELVNAWTNSVPPSVVASKLRLKQSTVIRAYVQLDHKGA